MQSIDHFSSALEYRTTKSRLCDECTKACVCTPTLFLMVSTDTCSTRVSLNSRRVVCASFTHPVTRPALVRLCAKQTERSLPVIACLRGSHRTQSCHLIQLIRKSDSRLWLSTWSVSRDSEHLLQRWSMEATENP